MTGLDQPFHAVQHGFLINLVQVGGGHDGHQLANLGGQPLLVGVVQRGERGPDIGGRRRLEDLFVWCR